VVTGRPKGASVALLLILSMLLPACYAGERINMLIAGNIGLINVLKTFFDNEPLVTYHAVPAYDPGATFGLSENDIVKMIRLYFPRTYKEMKGYDIIILTQPEYYHFTPKQDQMMYDAIREGAGGINDASVFSIVSGIAESWSNSLTQRAFPNDAPAVTAKSCGEASGLFFQVIINRNANEAILTTFIPFGVEKVSVYAVSRMVIHRQGSDLLAWQLGNFFQGKVDYMAAWNYEKGRTITTGDFMGSGWLGYPSSPDANQYSPEILMNMLFWLTKRNLIQDVELFHRIKSGFADYKSRMTVLISLKDFIEKFGANTQRIQEEIEALQTMYNNAAAAYMDQDFAEAEKELDDGFERFAQAEAVARKVKESALLWVYIIEWLVSSSTLFISGFILWTLMVKRRLYREVKATRLTEITQ